MTTILANSDFSFLDILSKLVIPGVSILLSTLLALHAIRRADLRERARRDRDDLVVLANEFMELAKKPIQELGASVERYDKMPHGLPADMREAFVSAQTFFNAQSLHLTSKLKLLGRTALISSVDNFSIAVKHAYKRVSDFADSKNPPTALIEDMNHAIKALPSKQQECFGCFVESLHREDAELSNCLSHRIRVRVGAIINNLRRHFGCE